MQRSEDKFDFHRLRSEAYQHIDSVVDSFSFIRDVVSDLLYGAPGTDDVQISVILPTFQRRELFEEALTSVLRQECAGVSWECLVVDNTPLDDRGSTPALDVVRKCGDSRVLYYHNRVNIGTGYNWNRGVELARGKWVCFLHDDDVLFPDALRNIVRIINSQSGGRIPLGSIQARRVMFTDSSQLAGLRHGRVPYFEPLTKTRALIRGEPGTGAPSCGTTFLKQAYLGSGGVNYDFGLSADAVQGYQIMEHYRVIRSDCALGAYRWAENETLKKSSMQELVHSDYLFARYRYAQSSFSRIWGRVFWRAEYNENIRYKIRDGKRKNLVLTPQDFESIVPYRKTNPILYVAYKAFQRLYSLCSIIAASI